MKPVRCTSCKSKAICIFSKLKGDELSRLKEIIRTSFYEKRDTIFQQGSPVFSCYIICEGKAEVVWRTEAGDKQILKLLGPGDLLEVEALYSEESHSTYARVLEDAYVAFIDKGSFFRLMEKHPALNLEVIARLARDSKRFQRELVMHAYRGVKERLCKLLWNLAEKYGVESENEGSLMINIRLTHAELAEMIGSSRETVTECLCTLKERGLISYSHHRITICDVSSFRSLVEHLL